jgi:hypothetical protein
MLVLEMKKLKNMSDEAENLLTTVFEPLETILLKFFRYDHLVALFQVVNMFY